MLQTECGYTPAEIAEMTLFDVRRLGNHWRQHPTLRTLVRAIAGSLGVKIEPAAANKHKHMNADEFAALVKATDGGRSLGTPNG